MKDTDRGRPTNKGTNSLCIDLLDTPQQCKLLGQVGVVKITQPTVLGMNDFRELLCSMAFMSPFDGDRSISYIFLSNKKYCRNVRFYFSEFIVRIKSIKICPR